MDKEYLIGKLCEAVEIALDRKMRTPKDFKFLSDSILEKQNKTVSPTTLKRMWGYLSEPVTPRLSTLNILSQFVGYRNWRDFCISVAPEMVDITDEERRELLDNQENTNKVSMYLKNMLFGIVLVIFIVSFVVYKNYNVPQPNDSYVLKIGQKFETYKDYLALFGIKDTVRYWDKVHPHYPNILIWGPEYKNPNWQNSGDPNQMMPTITERWAPPGIDSTIVKVRNHDNYYRELRINEIRITFMKNLKDSCYVFLGVYRMDIEKSDTTHCVWKRVIERCDLNNLKSLERFRN